MTEFEHARTVTADDATRGRRRIRIGAAGAPTWIERADGRRIRIVRDERRRTLSISDDAGPLCTLRGSQEGADVEVTATDHDGETTARRDEYSTRVARRTATGDRSLRDAVLRVDLDTAGNVRRVTLPGSDQDLIYAPEGAGRWAVRTSDGSDVLAITTAGATQRVALPDGWGWQERARPGQVEITALAGQPLVSTKLGPGGRVVGRVDTDGALHTYERDADGRLVAWTGPQGTTRWDIGEHGIEAVATGHQRRRWERDAGSRVVAQVGGETVRYDYDACGQRTHRHDADGETRYHYDLLGQLTSIDHADGHHTAIGWDGLGRQVWIERDGRRLHEHRDLDGRLWAVTDASGRAIHVFVWFQGRVVARLDGPVGSPVAETYLTDLVGTLLASARCDGDRWTVEGAVGNPYGEVVNAYRPTLFGHIGDTSTGLICFGSRHLDPETASFLTPDPWHGGADDPRVMGGASPSTLALTRETPTSGIHPYALSQHDPTSRPDLDGHFAVGNAIFTLLLAPTWGFPLTSVSLFAFMPLNLYFELIGLIVFVFRGFSNHPWPQHSIVNMKVGAASGRLGTVSLALNGFLPRVIAGGGVDADRAVTIGHVIWANRRYFTLLDRPRVLSVQDVSGPPDATGAPSLGSTAFSQSAAGSIVVVEGTDTDGRLWIHGSWWTRGGASHVGLRSGSQTFEDRVAPGTAHSTGSLLLAQPLPERMTWPMKPDDRGQLEVTEYTTGRSSVGEVVADAWFAITVDADAGLTVGDAVRIQVKNRTVPPAYAGIHQIIQAAKPILILDHPLPARLHFAPMKSGLKLAKLSPATEAAAGSSTGWTAPPSGPMAPAAKTLTVPDPGHGLATGDVLRIEPKPTAPGPERPFVYGEVAVVRVTLELTVAPPPGQTGATAVLLVPDGTVARGRVEDPASHPEQVTVVGAAVLEAGDAVAVTASGGRVHHARVSAASAGAESASITLDPPIPATVVSTAGTTVNLARLAAANRDRDTGSVDDQTPSAVVVSTRSNQLFGAGMPIQLEQGGTTTIRTVDSVSATTIELRDEMVDPAGPTIGPNFDVTVQAVASSTASGDIAADRFVKRVSGDLPSAYGNWPDEIMGLAPQQTGFLVPPVDWRFFLRASTTPGALHPKFDDLWQPLTLGTDHYWLLASPLPLVTENTPPTWEPDPDDHYPRRHKRHLHDANWKLHVQRFSRGTPAVHRPLPGGEKVLCRPAETQVPDAPRQRWSLADALDEHELGHTLQNTYWGPLLGALPLQGLFRTVADTFAAAGEERPDWMQWNPFDHASSEVGFDDTNMFELLSMAGLMQLIWTFVILGPSLFELLGEGSEEEQRFAEKVLGMNWSDWGQVFNPVNQQIINRIPEIDPGADAGERWALHLAHIAARATDMRAWTPLIGLVPLLLPDGPTNFIEQQASRRSGDLYSTILTVNDRSNRDLRLRLGNALLSRERQGDQTIPLGRSARLMVYGEHALDRFLRFDRCDSPTLLRYQLGGGGADELLRIKVDAIPGGAVGLVPSGHFEQLSGAPLVKRTVEGPDLPGGRPAVDFDEVPVGTELRPLPRSLVPAAPAVVRAVGVYFLPACAGTFNAEAYSSWEPRAGDSAETLEKKRNNAPHTYKATITVAGDVTLDGTSIDWSTPLATGATHPAATPAAASHFEAEAVPLTVADQDTSDWIAEGDGGLRVARTDGGAGWTVTFAPLGDGATATRGRLRIFRPVRPTDPALFDFEHEDEPTRTGIRSYLDDGLWLPIRDVPVEIQPLPALPDATITAADDHELTLVIALAGPASIVVTPAGGRTLSCERIGADGPRGERWRLHLDGNRAAESNLVFAVQVTFGGRTDRVLRRFELTVTSNFTIDTDPAGGPYTVQAGGAALTLRIAGGTAPFTAGALPGGLRADISGTTVTFAADDTAATGDHVLSVTDGDGRVGQRRITVEA